MSPAGRSFLSRQPSPTEPLRYAYLVAPGAAATSGSRGSGLVSGMKAISYGAVCSPSFPPMYMVPMLFSLAAASHHSSVSFRVAPKPAARARLRSRSHGRRRLCAPAASAAVARQTLKNNSGKTRSAVRIMPISEA